MFRLPPTSFAIDRRFHIRVVSIIRQPLSSSIQLNSNSLFHFHCHKLRNLLRSHKDARLISEAHDTTIPGAHLQAHSHALSLSLSHAYCQHQKQISMEDTRQCSPFKCRLIGCCWYFIYSANMMIIFMSSSCRLIESEPKSLCEQFTNAFAVKRVTSFRIK